MGNLFWIAKGNEDEPFEKLSMTTFLLSVAKFFPRPKNAFLLQHLHSRSQILSLLKYLGLEFIILYLGYDRPIAYFHGFSPTWKIQVMEQAGRTMINKKESAFH